MLAKNGACARRCASPPIDSDTNPGRRRAFCAGPTLASATVAATGFGGRLAVEAWRRAGWKRGAVGLTLAYTVKLG